MSISVGEFQLGEPRLSAGQCVLIEDMRSQIASCNGCPDTDYSADWSEQLPFRYQQEDGSAEGVKYKSDDIRVSILSRLAGRPLIDLCGGALRPFFEAVRSHNVSSYLSIDQHIEYVPLTKPQSVPVGRLWEFNPEWFKIAGGTIESDALTALSALDVPGGANFAINGIDGAITSLAKDEYWQEVVGQIDRLVPTGGHVIGITAAGGLLKTIAESGNYAVEMYDYKGNPADRLEEGYNCLTKIS